MGGSTGEEYSQPDTPSLNLRLFNTLGRFRVPDDSPSCQERCEGEFPLMRSGEHKHAFRLSR
jgi:hypothetical protein